MKKLLLTLCLVLGLLFVVAAEVPADTTLQLYIGPFSDGHGGEFTVISPSLDSVISNYASTALNNGHFITFCLETTEYFSPGVSYNYAISTKAIMGQNPPNGDPISIGTAYLYRSFADGTLVIDSIADAVAFQITVWWLENEVGYGDPGNTNAYRNFVIAKFGGAATAMADANGAYGVYALNLTDASGARAQDQLVAVPEPGILILLGIAMSAIGAASWRLRKL